LWPVALVTAAIPTMLGAPLAAALPRAVAWRATRAAPR
jgi:hypothetical protein